MQHSVLSPVILSGIGLHSGAETTLRILPAAAGTGIVFVRTDVTDRDNVVPAKWDHVTDTRLCTLVSNAAGVFVGTIEHLMAALAACGVDNAVIELDGPEVPIMDGSSAEFVEAIEAAGLKTLAAPRRAIRILDAIRIQDGDKWVVLRPGMGSRYKVTIEFPHPAIGAQSYSMDLLAGEIASKVADCRTFGFMHEVNALRAMGLALGGSLDNAIVLDDKAVLNPEGLRHSDEFARHKVLDAIGDLYIAGGIILGDYEAYKPGHNMNNRVLRALFDNPSAWEWVDLYMDSALSGSAPAHGTPALVPSRAQAVVCA